MVDPAERKSVIRCFSAANSPVGPYGPIEIVLMMTFNETVSGLKGTCCLSSHNKNQADSHFVILLGRESNKDGRVFRFCCASGVPG